MAAPHKPDTKPDTTVLEQARRLTAAQRLLRAKQARSSLVAFTELMMPDPGDPDNPAATRYDAQPHHYALADGLERVERGEILGLIVIMPPRHGKQIADSVPVLTSGGWKLHGQLKIGDRVYTPAGRTTEVVAVGEPTLPKMEVGFSDGTSIKCHPDHEWAVYSRASRKIRVVETSHLARLKLTSGPVGKRGGRYIYQLPAVSPLGGPAVELPIAPYALGAWLGDGTSAKPCLTCVEPEIPAAMVACGYAVTAVWHHKDTGVPTHSFAGPRPNVMSVFSRALRTEGLIDNKHIPDAYFGASLSQRLELLAGLIDTDGHTHPQTGRVRISTSMPVLARDVARLVSTFGWRPSISEVMPRAHGKIVPRKLHYQIGFNPSLNIPCRLERKRPKRLTMPRRVAIAYVRAAEPELGRCIQVADPDGVYLLGDRLHGTHNSQLTSRSFPPWLIGRDPYRSIILATYGDEFAGDFGREVRSMMRLPVYQQIFPGVLLRKGSQASDRLQTEAGGIIAFVGRGTSTTGRGGDFLLIDDPIKDAVEAGSVVIRDQTWNWFTKVLLTRRATDMAPVVITLTRWHEDDIVGRITDPKNPHYNADFAARFKIIHLAAEALENDPLGRRKGEPLWGSKFGLPFLKSARDVDPVGYSALYQGSPTPEEGDYFKHGMIQGYRLEDMPRKEDLRMYGASDHAIGLKQRNDKTCMGLAGVDHTDTLWIMPDLVWDRLPSDVQVERMIDLGKAWEPLIWWAEAGHISKSLGPFLTKRMAERETYMHIVEQVPSTDKVTRAQSIRARMAQGKVRYPLFAPWYADAVDEMLKFPHGTHDDFVDYIAHLGLGLARQVRSQNPDDRVKAANENKLPAVGSFAWVKMAAGWKARAEKLRQVVGGM